MADVEPVAKKSKQGPPAAATMLRVESSILGPASAGRRDPPESKPAAVSPPEIVRDVNVVSDPPSPQAEPPLELAIISDPGEDLDDELAMVFLRHMVKQDPSLIVRCVVCNLRPATKRAALMRQTLDALRLDHVSVGVGSEVVPETKANSASWDFLPSSAETPRNGQDLLREAFEQAKDGALTLLCISALTDTATFLETHEQLFRRKVREVVIMGGVQTPKKNELLIPDDAANNAFDPQAARYVYRRLQELEVPTVVVSRAAAYACPVPRALYDDLASTGHAVGVRIRDAQREAIARLWRRAHASGVDRAHLPERCDPRWFRDTFCDGRGESLGANDDVWDLVVGFNLYDVIALLACSPSLRRSVTASFYLRDGVDATRRHQRRRWAVYFPILGPFRARRGRVDGVGLRRWRDGEQTTTPRRRHFAPHAHTVRGATHYIVGLGSNATHVRDTDNLSKALADGVRDGLVDGDVGLDLQPE